MMQSIQETFKMSGKQEQNILNFYILLFHIWHSNPLCYSVTNYLNKKSVQRNFKSTFP